MPLSEYEKTKVRQIARTTIKNINTDDYMYDNLYGRRYSLNDVNSILKSINLKLLQDEIDLLTYNDEFQIIKRTIIAIGKSLLSEKSVCYDNALKFGILCLMWGYASQGYGLYRIGKIFRDPLNTDRFNKNILNSFNYLQKDDIKKAYLLWEYENHIPWLGESFFTKILYFISQIIDESCPKVLIKDSFTSMNAAALFGIKRLTNRGLEYFIDYISVLRLAAKELDTTAEKVEEFLFSNSKKISSQINKNELLEYSFRLSSNYIYEYSPPTVLNQDLCYNEYVPDRQDNYPIMLVADGKPEVEIPEMTYDSKMMNVQENFYSNQRSRIIVNANIEANKYHQSIPTYILTTGFGAVPISANIPYYNIPGEIAIKDPRYWVLYMNAIKRILPKPEDGKIFRVSIVYYAGKSKGSFRDGIHKIIKGISGDNCLKQKYDIHFCMYGCRQHSSNIWKGNWGSLIDIYKSLSSLDFRTLDVMKNRWLKENIDISPFFMYF